MMKQQPRFEAKFYYNLSLDRLVPEDNLLRLIANAVDFAFIRPLCRPFYSHTGRPSVDPVVLFKMLLVGYLYGITSERRLARELNLNLAYRWFLGYDFDQPTPDHSVLSKARARFGPEVFESFFRRSIDLCREAGLLDEGPVYVDSTLIQASAAVDLMVPRDEHLQPPLSVEEYVRRLCSIMGRTSLRRDIGTISAQTVDVKPNKPSDLVRGEIGMRKHYWTSTLSQRLSRRRMLAAYGAASLSAMVLSACGGNDGKGGGKSSEQVSKVIDDSKGAKRGGTLAKWGAESSGYDPMTGGGTTLARFYSRLFRIKGGYMGPPTGEVEGDLAESWEFSADRLTLTAKLSQKAHFAPVPQITGVSGRVPDARDVAYSYEYLKAVGAQRATLANDLNPQAPVASITAADDRTVIIKLAQPIGSALNAFGALAVVPKESADTKVINLQTQAMGSGPWYLAELSPSAFTRFKRNPGFGQDARGVPYIEEVFQPVVPEYATQLAQFRTGNIHIFPELADIRAEDVLPTKQTVPELEMLATGIKTNVRRMVFGQLPESAFRDVRVRQAWSLAIDNDALIDVLFNVSKFQAEGLPMQTAWSSTALRVESWKGWWLDPQGKDFGPNAKYFKYDIAEAKKLLAAAGHATGLDFNARYSPGGHPYGSDYSRNAEIVLGMVPEAGFRPKIVSLNFATEYRDLTRSMGKFEGVSFAQSSALNAITDLYNTYNSAGGSFNNWDPDGRSTYAGDPTLNDLTTKIRLEFDDKRRLELAHELQRHDAEKQYTPWIAGGANSFILHWPSIRGRLVWQSDEYREDCTYWLDQTKRPFV